MIIKILRREKALQTRRNKLDELYEKTAYLKAGQDRTTQGTGFAWRCPCGLGQPRQWQNRSGSQACQASCRQAKNVVLLLCDMTAPMLPCICPPSDLECEKSLGSILAAPHVNESLVKYHMITHKKMDHLTILGMLKGENEYSYTPFGETQARELIESLRKIAPFIIIDCGSYIANDVLSAVALLESDAVLRLANCDLKSVSYLSSQLSTLQSAGLDFEKQYKCSSNIQSNHGIEHMGGAMEALASSSRIPRNWNSSTLRAISFQI